MKKSNGTVANATKEEVLVSRFNLTEKEQTFLKVMGYSNFWENGLDSVPWDYSVNEFLPYVGKVRSGVISSLEQKGVIVVTKKVKGDIAGTYHLTDEAKGDKDVIKLVTRESEDEVAPTEEKVEEAVVIVLLATPSVDFPETVILNGTWKDGIEAKSFEGAVLNILKDRFSCIVTQVKDATSNDFEVTGTRDNIDLLSATFNELVRGIRVATKEAYKASDKSLSQFKFTTTYHIELLKTLDQNLVVSPITLE